MELDKKTPPLEKRHCTQSGQDEDDSDHLDFNSYPFAYMQDLEQILRNEEAARHSRVTLAGRFEEQPCFPDFIVLQSGYGKMLPPISLFCPFITALSEHVHFQGAAPALRNKEPGACELLRSIEQDSSTQLDRCPINQKLDEYSYSPCAKSCSDTEQCLSATNMVLLNHSSNKLLRMHKESYRDTNFWTSAMASIDKVSQMSDFVGIFSDIAFTIDQQTLSNTCQIDSTPASTMPRQSQSPQQNPHHDNVSTSGQDPEQNPSRQADEAPENGSPRRRTSAPGSAVSATRTRFLDPAQAAEDLDRIEDLCGGFSTLTNNLKCRLRNLRYALTCRMGADLQFLLLHQITCILRTDPNRLSPVFASIPGVETQCTIFDQELFGPSDGSAIERDAISLLSDFPVPAFNITTFSVRTAHIAPVREILAAFGRWPSYELRFLLGRIPPFVEDFEQRLGMKSQMCQRLLFLRMIQKLLGRTDRLILRRALMIFEMNLLDYHARPRGALDEMSALSGPNTTALGRQYFDLLYNFAVHELLQIQEQESDRENRILRIQEWILDQPNGANITSPPSIRTIQSSQESDDDEDPPSA